MGTTLTGTTPQDTYDSLIKVTDNGPLSGTAKYLSDGLGNDSKLALSTGNIGIGTTSPSTTLHLDASGGATIRLQRTSASSNRFDMGTDGTNMEFNVRDTGAFTFGGGNVGIGLSSAGVKLDVSQTMRVINTGEAVLYLNNSVVQHQIAIAADPSNKLSFRWGATEGMALTENGLTFNGDTAAANALDDYEEGTWTPTITGAGGNPTVTYAAGNTGGIYTKIGNQVTVSFEVRWTALSGGSGAVSIAGLPYSRRVTTLPDGDRLIIDSYNNTISGKYLTGNVGSGNSSIALSMVNSAAAPTDLLISNLDTSGLGFLRGTVTYFV